MSRKLRGGFTLIELLVVISIIGLLSSVVLTAVNSVRVKARDNQRIQNLRQIALALQLYYDKEGHYPNMEGATKQSSPVTCGTSDTGWNFLKNTLVPNYIPNLPNEYIDGDNFYFYCSDHPTNAQEYILRVSLEDRSTAAASQFKQQFYTIWDGDDPRTCESQHSYCLAVCQTNAYDNNNSKLPNGCGSYTGDIP